MLAFYYGEGEGLQLTLNEEIDPVNPVPAREGSYSVVGGLLPAGLKLDKKTGVISGTPTVRVYNMYRILYVSDDGETEDAAFVSIGGIIFTFLIIL